MPSRRDQIQSYQFAVQRAVSALVAGEADPQETPLRRLVGAAFGSIMVGVLALAAVGIFGLVTGRSADGWRSGGAVVLERESGAAFVVIDGTLRPTANFTSAVLLNGSPTTVTVPRSDLADMPRGPMLGIPLAPNALPGPDDLLTEPWSLCSSAMATPSGGAGSATVLLVGAQPPVGRALAADEAVLARVPGGSSLHLIWHGYRYQINNPAVVLDALAWQQAPQLAVGAAWLNALPEGHPLEPLTLSGRGRDFTLRDLDDAKVGQVLVVETSGRKQYYLVGSSKLRPITAVEASILLADPASREAYGGASPQARPFGASAANDAPREAASAPSPEQPPSDPPRIAGLTRPDAAACTVFGGDADPTSLLLTDGALRAQSVPTPGSSAEGAPLVDRVAVPPGHGVIVQAQPAPGAAVGTLFLVTDLGIRYPLASAQVLTMLGFASVAPVVLPAGLVARLPVGPELDPVAAGNAIATIDQ